MYLVINVSEFYFALSVKVVDRIFDVGAINTNEEGFFLNGKEVNIINAEELLKIRSGESQKKTTAILLSTKNEKPNLLLVSSVKGFFNEREMSCLPRNELLKIYGFELITRFCLCRDKLLFVLDELSIEKRIAGMVWE